MKLIKQKIAQQELVGALRAPRFVSCLCILALQSVMLVPSLSANERSTPVIQAELFMQMEQMQQELQVLRNLVEQQGNTIQRMQTDQRNRYLDLDQRLQDQTQRLNALEEADPPVLLPTPASTQRQEQQQVAQDQNRSARDAYAEAYALVPERRFDEAVTAFNRFILDFPESRLVGNGYYWIGEIYMAQNRTQDAERMFDIVVRNHPDSFKVADSKYKLGLIYARYGDQRRARDMMRAIIADHPQEPAAALARAYLERQS